MKYYPFEENVNDNNGGIIYRDCLFVNLKTLQIQDHPDDFVGDPKDLIISSKDIPEGCIVVDALIAPIILELNKKGYMTIYSCQGHMDKNICMEKGFKKYNHLTSTYVIFEAPQPERYMENLINPPHQFEVTIESAGRSDARTEALRKIYGVRRYKDYNNKSISIHAPIPYLCDELNDDNLDQEVFDKYTEINLMMLASWVGKLPDLTQEPIEQSNALYDERIIDKDTARQCGFDFESIQEFASDIKDCHDVMVESINEINHEMTILNDMVESISVRLSSLKLVEDIRDIDDTSMYESRIIEESFPKKDYDNKSKYNAPISPEVIKKLGEEYFNTTLHVKDLANEVCDINDLVNKACEDSYDERRKEFFDGIMNHKTK